MGDVDNDETVQSRMVQTDAECKRNSVIGGKPKPPLPKKPPVAVKPKVLTRGDSQDKGSSNTLKSPPPLPKTPPKGPGGTAVKNALSVRTSASPDRSCNITPPLSNHVTDSHRAAKDSSNHITGSSSAEPCLTNHTALTSQVEGETCDKVTTTNNILTPYQTRSKTLERCPTDQRKSESYLAEHANTLPKTPPKVSPKPGKKPPNVLPKPRLSKKFSESDLNSSILNSSSESEKSISNNNIVDFSHSSSNKEKDICHCDEMSSDSNFTINKISEDGKLIVNDERLKNTLDLDLQNGHSRPPPNALNFQHSDHKNSSFVKEVHKQVQNENCSNLVDMKSNMNMHNDSNNIDCKLQNCGGASIQKTLDGKSSVTLNDLVAAENLSENSNQNVLKSNENSISINGKNTDDDNIVQLRSKKSVTVIENSPLKSEGDSDSSKIISSDKCENETFLRKNNSFDDADKQNPQTRRLSVPLPTPRKSSPKPRPTPRKRLSLSKSCEKTDFMSEYTDCMSVKTVTTNSERLLEDSVNTESHCVTPSANHSIGNISKIESKLTVEKDKRKKLVNEKPSASTILLQPEDKHLQKHIDFSPMTEEALGETSSLLDEIEQIVSRRISALGGLSSSDFSLRKAHSIETSTPVRPPRRKQKNRKLNLEQSHDACASDTDSLFGDSSFKGSASSINILDDGDQSFKGSNSSLASNQSESAAKKPCPPKPPRKKLLKLNRSQSDVSAAKYLERNKENVDKIELVDTAENKKKNGGGRSPSLPARKARSLTVDFHVPANQGPLLREIELANQRNAKLDLYKANRQKITPKRKAPPPPPKVKVTGPINNNLIREAEYNDIDEDKPRTMSVGDPNYVEIPEEFLDPNFQNVQENDSFQRSTKSPSPPELPPRNINPGTPISSPQLSIKSLPAINVVTPIRRKERPVSDLSQNSSLSSQESPMQDELSSTDSEGEDEGDRAARKRAKKILNIAKEISSSEHVFVDVLRLLNVDFRLHISRSTEKAGRPVVPSEVLNRILKYLPQLQNFNEDLLRDIEERVSNWQNCKQVADIFVKKGPFLKMYTSYITDFEETNKIYDDALKKVPSFQQCVKEFEMSPRCASLGIRHYLLKPIQRIPQYKLLLQDYLKHLTPESEDYKSTLSALAIVSEVADHANDSMRQGDQVQKMLEIQKSLDGQFEVIKPGRILIKEGELMKLSRKEMQPRMFFLFNDVLLYTTPTPTGGYRLNNVLTLVGMKITLPSSEEYNTEFNIVGLQRSFAVEASSVEERDDWVKILTEAIDGNTQRRNTFETVKAGNQVKTVQNDQSFYDKDFVLGSKAPIWIPDARVTMCMLCTCEFSVAWRRHHCRSCGRVICASCSDNKAPLEYLRNKPARVCNECFQKLVTDFEDKVNTGTVTEAMTEDTDGSLLSLSSLKERFQQIRRSARFTTKVKRPNRLVEVRANDLDCSMSGNLRILKGKKWKKYWFLLKDKVLYKFKASEDVAAIDTLPVIGYDVIRFSENFEGIAAHLLFQLSHKNQSPLMFQTDNPSSTERWVKVMEEAAKG